jgi:hypothetical protein
LHGGEPYTVLRISGHEEKSELHCRRELSPLAAHGTYVLPAESKAPFTYTPLLRQDVEIVAGW